MDGTLHNTCFINMIYPWERARVKGIVGSFDSVFFNFYFYPVLVHHLPKESPGSLTQGVMQEERDGKFHPNSGLSHDG